MTCSRLSYVITYILAEDKTYVARQADSLDIKEIAAKLIAEDKTTEESLMRIRDARLRVAEAQAAKEELEQKMKAEAFEARMQEAQQAQEAQTRLADVELQVAQAALAQAQADQAKADQEEQRWKEAISQENERQESIKAGIIAAAAGTAASLPLTATYSDTALVAAFSTLSFTASCMLLGVVYRYALRQDLGNSQLKGGVVAAFGLVRGLAVADALQSAAGGELTTELLAKGALLAGHSVLTFGFAAVALEFTLQRGILKAYGAASIEE